MNNIKSVLQIIEHIRYILTRKQKIDSVLVFGTMILSSLLELLGVSVIYPFLQLMLDEQAVKDKLYVAWLYKLFPSISRSSVIVFLGAAVAVVYLLKNVVALFCVYCQQRYSARINKELSVKMLDSYMKRPYEYFINTNSSIIMRGLGGDVNSVYSIILNAFQGIAEVFSIILISVYLLSVDLLIAIASMGIAAIAFLGITLGFKGIMKQLGKDVRGLQASSAAHCYQTIHGIKEITVLDRRKCFVDKYQALANDIEKKTITSGVVGAAPDRVLEGVCIVGVMSILCVRIYMGVNLETFIPTLGAFVMGVFRIMPSIAKISTRINNIVYFIPGMNNTYQILKDDEAFEKRRLIEEKQLVNQIDEQHLQNLHFEQKVVIDNIYWKYVDGTDFVLKGLCLSINKGESIGLIGSSGGGKSTLIDVLMTLFKPQKGTITMDGIDIFLMQSRWRKLIGYVPQSIFLIESSVKANVAFGLPDKEVTDEKVWKALEQAQLKEFVESLPNGLDTVVGERGVKFSGGQRQRIAIARALYDEPEILILDEATAALDNETERAFMEAIESLQGSKTIILVAHRLTTVRNCDKVYEIKNGIAIERDIDEILKDA